MCVCVFEEFNHLISLEEKPDIFAFHCQESYICVRYLQSKFEYCNGNTYSFEENALKLY